MPRWDRDARAAGPVVGAIGPGGFTVDGGVYPGLLLTPERADRWSPPALAELTIADLELALRLQPLPEFLLLGTGPTLSFPPRSLVRTLDEHGVGLEPMDSRAAARTWDDGTSDPIGCGRTIRRRQGRVLGLEPTQTVCSGTVLGRRMDIVKNTPVSLGLSSQQQWGSRLILICRNAPS